MPRRSALAASKKSRLCAFLSRGVSDGDREGDSRFADLHGDEAAKTEPLVGLAFDLDLNLLRGHYADIVPLLPHPGPPPPQPVVLSMGRVLPPSSN